ncbi:uncharacterized protein LOC109535377 [Dendroctonus ponderosae]|uniref:Saposin B-type domain-containing protein n=1 Tax=Dendroctonus ponderosae TaxID=77166 RepID=A0AAR5P700_DENPD|nr:uncharacterized protein LOC109535377 [Dendroctonus ponderosae]KAH0999239.1 hypothetical protein HUJ04_013599 [Dendroctonus ponderosae]KAH0999240.1 hypothetical protein HUJ04_013600 [Dendroctonus ponderosae]KAH1010690.1 hypothetical protein HUJ05_004946 [Dendroctonus ponderosae]
MFLYKFILFALVLLILRCGGASYVYPLWSSEHLKIENEESCDRDATVTEFVLEMFVLPIKDGFCNICANFSEVYNCVLEYLDQFKEKAPKESPSYLSRTLDLFGLAETPTTATPQSCSYYSLMVVTITIVLLITMIFVAKKLVEYVKEDDRVFPHIVPNYKNKCPCYQEGEE